MRIKRVMVASISVVIIVVIISVIILQIYSTDHDNPPTQGDIIEGIGFTPEAGSFIFTDPTDTPINETMRESLNSSRFFFEFYLEGQPINYSIRYHYEYFTGKDMMSRGNIPNGEYFYISDWEYEKSYNFSLRFICESSDDSMKKFSLFNETRYIYGNFKIINEDRDDIVQFSNITGVLMDDSPIPTFVYFGDVEDARLNGINSLKISAWVFVKPRAVP